MSMPAITLPADELRALGLRITDRIHYQSSPEELVNDCLRRAEGTLSDTGALVIRTGEFTGRSPKDRFIVKDELTSGYSPETASAPHANPSPNIASPGNNGPAGPASPNSVGIDWNEFNQPLEEKYFDLILEKTIRHLNRSPELWIRDAKVCADPRFGLRLRIINETPAINLFAYNMFIRPEEEELETFHPDWQLLSAPGLRLEAKECGIRQHNAVVISFQRRMILLAGTGYTGETKKAVFTILNFLLPREKNILSLHGSANIGPKGDTAIFFGLSGTGKTTLSADPERTLIGDDEHGWTDDNIFNFEGGCYAKCIHLDEDKEPAIFRAIRKGALVENTPFFPGTRTLNFDDGSITENTRVSYPLDYIDNAREPAIGGLPRNIFFLTCDAYGVLPPIARLTPEQAMYQFISGYTAKVAGTETGVTEPKSTFSACFGAPFLPLHPGRYAAMLGEKIRRHQVQVWLVNTGWSGGPYLTGHRIHLSHTRAMITAALEGRLNDGSSVRYSNHPVFGVAIPDACPGVPSALLNPRNTWADPKAYDQAAHELAGRFVANFKKYADYVNPEILAAGPGIAVR